MTPVVAIALSGGIDSLMSAYILKEKGYRVLGVHFITGFESAGSLSPAACVSVLSSQLDLPVHLLDLSTVFRNRVVNYFIQTYRDGLTPNPCLVCNPVIKFDALFHEAQKLGANFLATGHYARVARGDDGRFRLLKGIDRHKDQSYFLSFLSQDQLSRTLFPLGEMTKNEVKALAIRKGFAPVSGGESQDVCFIHEKTYSEFLQTYGGLNSKPGPVMTVEGDIIGKHTGLYRFTIGQRRGIGCPSSAPYYAVRLIPATNTLVVGRKQDLVAESCLVDHVHWIRTEPELPMTADVRLRYRHRAVSSGLIDKGGKILVRFSVPQHCPTPGQGAVFYNGDEVLGAGIIT